MLKDSALQQMWRNYQILVADVKEALIPGAWSCAQCSYRHQDASPGVDDLSVPLHCPNDQTVLHRMTWKEDYERLSLRLREVTDELRRLKAQKTTCCNSAIINRSA